MKLNTTSSAEQLFLFIIIECVQWTIGEGKFEKGVLIGLIYTQRSALGHYNVAFIEGVSLHQGWLLRGVPLYVCQQCTLCLCCWEVCSERGGRET